MHLSVKPDLKIDIHLTDVYGSSGGTGDSNVESGNEDSGRRPGK